MLKTLGKLVLFVSGGLLLLGAIAVGTFWWFLHSTAQEMCGNEILSITDLIDHEARAIVFQRDCGATTGFSTQVSILRLGEELPNEVGNTFIADRNNGKAPKGKGGGPEVRVEAVSTNTFKITYHPNAKVFKQQSKWNGVIIEYGNL